MMYIFLLIKHDNNQTNVAAKKKKKNKGLSTSAYSAFTKFTSSQKIGAWFVIGFLVLLFSEAEKGCIHQGQPQGVIAKKNIVVSRSEKDGQKGEKVG